jgi:hypothetical protein
MTIIDGPLLHFLKGRVMVRAFARSALLDPLPPLSGLGLMLSLVTMVLMLAHVPRSRPWYQRLMQSEDVEQYRSHIVMPLLRI